MPLIVGIQQVSFKKGDYALLVASIASKAIVDPIEIAIQSLHWLAVVIPHHRLTTSLPTKHRDKVITRSRRHWKRQFEPVSRPGWSEVEPDGDVDA